MNDIVQMSKGGTNFYPKTKVQAILGLQDSLVGTNLLKNTSDFSSNWNGMSSASTTTEYNGYPSMVFTSSNQQLAVQTFDVGKLENSFQYTSSFWAKADNTGDKACTLLWGFPEQVNFALTTDWVHYTAVLTSYSDANTNIDHSKYFLGVPDGNKGNVYIALPKIEKGPIATDYSLNPSEIATDGDVQMAITNALGKVATINVISQADYDALDDKSGVYFIKGGD